MRSGPSEASEPTSPAYRQLTIRYLKPPDPRKKEKDDIPDLRPKWQKQPKTRPVWGVFWKIPH